MKIYIEDIINGFTTGGLSDIEDSCLSLLAVYDIDAQEGVPLQRIADMVGLTRSSTDLETYRTLIKGKALANTSNGTIEDIDKVLEILFSGNAIRREYNCCIQIEVNDDPPSAELMLIYKEIIQECLPAGVGLIDILFYNSETLRYDVGAYDVNLWG